MSEGGIDSGNPEKENQAGQGLLILITNSFPGGNTEPFLNDEIHYLAKAFRKVVVFTFGTEPVERKLPGNVQRIILPSLWDITQKKRLGILLREPGTLMKMLAGAVNENGFRSFLRMRTLLINRAIYLIDFVDFICNSIDPLPSERVTAYSYWGDHKAIIPALLRKRGIAHYAISRIHGFEIYDRTGIYNFYRGFLYRWLNAVVAVSSDGQKTMMRDFPKWKQKFKLSRLGTVDAGIGAGAKPARMRVASCSAVHEIKRVPEIAKVMGSLDFEVEWVHFGAGQQFEDVQRIAAGFPAHVTADLKGHVGNEEILDYYRNNEVSVFVNFSTTEGIPVSIMEAMSFGIPVIAPSVGGIKEIVNPETGILLPGTATEDDLRAALLSFKTNSIHDQALRESTRRFWKANYDAETNFSAFAEHLSRGDF